MLHTLKKTALPWRAERDALLAPPSTPPPTAQDWAYDQYHSQIVTANRWQLAFWAQTGLSLLLGVGLAALLPLKTWEPIVIHRNTQTGEVWAEHTRTQALPETTAEMESDLVRYVIARETVSATDLGARRRQALFMSGPAVSKAYRALQHSVAMQQLLADLGEGGTRTVTVQDIVFLDAPGPHAPTTAPTRLAKLDFTTTDSGPNTGERPVEKAWVATVRWAYAGTPDEKAIAWENWNGFMVTDYRVDQRNLTGETHP